MIRSTGDAMSCSPRSGRLLAEAVRLLEHDGRHPQPDGDAVQRAIERGGDLEERIITRARNLAIAPQMEAAIHRVRAVLAWFTLAAAALALAAGAAAASGALAGRSAQPVNFFLVFTSVLLVQTLFLLLWLIVMVARPGRAPIGSLGALVLAGARRFSSAIDHDAAHVAAAAAVGGELHRARVARWAFGCITHALWLAFNVGAVAALLLLLSTRHYTFGWETTILDRTASPALIQAIGALPRLAGFDVPTRQQIDASQWTGSGPTDGFEASRKAWSSLLTGSIVIYGLLPRTALLVVCLAIWRFRTSRAKLDLAQPGFSSLRDRLQPAAHSLGIIDADGGSAIATTQPTPDADIGARERGRPAIVGLELDDLAGDWPPDAASIRWIDLGRVSGGADERRVLDELRDRAVQIGQVVLVCGLPNTPDRGAHRFAGALAGAAARLRVVLTAGQALRQRLGAADVALRVGDWRSVAHSAGVRGDDVLELDLAHLTDASAAKLQSWLGVADSAPDVRRIEQACEIIASHARRWQSLPSAGERAELHRELAVLHRGESHAWRALLRVPPDAQRDFGGAVRTTAQRMVELLPPSLRRSPRWMAVGAAAGALGCVAAATMVFPGAIAALPMWSGMGAAVAAILSPATRGREAHAPNTGDPANVRDAVDAALLFAIVLELQGRGEAEIARVLDATFHIDDSRLLRPEHVRGYLDEARHRFDLAMTRAMTESTRSERDAGALGEDSP